MARRYCEDCVKKLITVRCGTCNTGFCTDCFRLHEMKYGVFVGSPCKSPQEERNVASQS